MMWHTAVSECAPSPRGLRAPNIFTHTFHNSDRRDPNRAERSSLSFQSGGLTFRHIPVLRCTGTQKGPRQNCLKQQQQQKMWS